MVILIIVEAFAIWFWSIVFRAYCYMCEDLGGSSLGDNYEAARYQSGRVRPEQRR